MPTPTETYMSYLVEHGQTGVTSFPVKGNDFHCVQIDGQYFIGAVSKFGPHIGRFSALKRGYHMGDVALGVSGIYHTENRFNYGNEPEPAEWFICKYGYNEPRISIEGLSADGIHALAHEFGLYVRYPPKKHAFEPENSLYMDENMLLFYASPAFKSLCACAKLHPRKIKSFYPVNAYLGNWVESALAGEYKERVVANA